MAACSVASRSATGPTVPATRTPRILLRPSHPHLGRRLVLRFPRSVCHLRICLPQTGSRLPWSTPLWPSTPLALRIFQRSQKPEQTEPENAIESANWPAEWKRAPKGSGIWRRGEPGRRQGGRWLRFGRQAVVGAGRGLPIGGGRVGERPAVASWHAGRPRRGGAGLAVERGMVVGVGAERVRRRGVGWWGERRWWG